jgi:hypothetical protein
MRKIMLACAVLFFAAPGVSAQACLGLPSFAGGSVHLNGAGEFPDSATAWAAGIGAGRPNSLFGNLGGGQASYEGIDEKSTFGFLELGYQLAIGGAQLCPIAGGYFGVGPDDELAGIKLTSRGASAGAALGLPIRAGMLTFIPNAAVKYEYLSIKLDEENVGSSTEDSTSGIVDLGLALVFGDRFSLQPLYHIPFGADDVESNFGVFVAFSFGWRAR